MNLEKFLNEEMARPTEQLDEGVKEFFQGVVDGTSKLLTPILNPLKNTINKFVGSVKRVFFKTVKGRSGKHIYGVYEQDAPGGKVYGYIYPDKILSVAGKAKSSTTKATMLKVYIPNKLRGNAIKVAIDPRFLSNANKANSALTSNSVKQVQTADLPEGKSSFLNQLSEEILDEAGRIRRTTLQKISSQGQKEIAFAKKVDATYNSTDIGIPGPSAFIDNDALNEYISSAKIEIENLADILSEFLYALSWRKSYNQPVPSLLLTGFPGAGKTSLINSFGKERFKVHILEIASIYKEILGGFPVIEDVFKDPSLLDDRVAELRGKDELRGETQVRDKDGFVKVKEVKMKAADLFPEEDGRVHIFFMDEYNRDAEKMAAAMNLMLSGSIGTQYHLPKKTIVIASGNLGENIDMVKVAKMDSATFDRYDARVLLSRNIQRSLEYSRANTRYEADGIKRDLPDELRLDKIETVDPEKIEKYNIDMGGLVSSIDIFFNTMIEKYGSELMGKNWEKDLAIKPIESEYADDNDEEYDDDEMIYQITPRTIDKINTRLKNRAMRDWIEAKEGIEDLLDPKEIESYFLKNEITSRYMNCKKPEDWEKVWKKYKEEYLGRGIPSPTALYLHVMQWHDAYLPTVLKQIMGGNPRKIINNIRQTAFQAVKDANRVSINDIVFGYVPKKIWGHTITQKDAYGNDRKKVIGREGFVNLVKSVNSIKDQVMRGLVDIIAKNPTEKSQKNMIKTVSGHTYEEVKKALEEKGITINEPLDVIIFNIYVFIQDTNITEARVATFIRRLKEFGVIIDDKNGSTSETEADPGVKAAKAAKVAVAEVYSGLWQLSPVIKSTKFIQSGGDIDDDEIATNALKRNRVAESFETAQLEEELKNIFKKIL